MTTKTVAELQAEVESTLKAIQEKQLKTPDLSGVKKMDDQGRVVATIEQTDEEVSIESAGPQRWSAYKSMKINERRYKKQLKSLGYSPAGHTGAEFKSFSHFCREGFEHGGISFEGGNTTNDGQFLAKMKSHCKAIQGMSETVGSDGGFTVIPEFAPGVLDRIYSNNLFNETDNYTVSGNNMRFKANAETSRKDGSRAGGILGYWVDEGQALTKSKPTFRDVILKLNKLAVVVYLTDELLADTSDALESYVTKKASEEFNFLIGNSLINGDGSGQLLGVLNAPSLLAISKEPGQTAATIVTENIERMYNRFYAPNLPNAKWYHNQDCQSSLGLMTLGIGAAGIATGMNGDQFPNMSVAPFGTLKGRPRQPIEFAQTVGTQGDIILADMRQMLTISKGGIMQAVSMHVEFLTDQLALRFIMRVGGQPWEIAPITPYNGTNTQSNFITVATRA